MIYAIAICLAASGQCYLSLPAGPVFPYTFDSASTCLAMLPKLGSGQAVAENGRLYVNHSMWYECVEKTSWQPVIPPSPPKSFTIAMCFKTEAEAKAAAGHGAWSSGDAPCIQIVPVVHATEVGCLTKLYKETVKAYPKRYDLDGGEGRVYLHGKSHEMWLQCYDTK